MNKPTLLVSALLLPSLSACTDEQQPTKLEQAFTGEMLGANLRYFESIAGVPRETWEERHTYNVDGCALEVSAPGDKISSLTLEVSEQCQASLKSFLGESFTPDESLPLTFGNFRDHTGEFQFYAECLAWCGNAYDPSVYAVWEGPRAANFIQLKLGFLLVSDAAIEAANKWESAIMSAHGEDYVMSTRFNCEDHFNQEASIAFQDVIITEISIGYDIRTPGC